jgi:hypothetical protein
LNSATFAVNAAEITILAAVTHEDHKHEAVSSDHEAKRPGR